MGPSDVLAEVDLRVANLLKRRCGVTDPLILDLVVLLVAAQRRGHSCLDLERVDEFLAGLIDKSTAALTGGRVVDSRQIPSTEDLVAALRACEAVSIHTSWPSATPTEESGDVPDAEEPAFDTDEEAYVREAVRDVQRFVVPRVVRRLPASRGVLYAVRDRNVNALIDPRFNLRITVQSLRFSGTNTNLLPCMDVNASLIDIDTEVTTWQTTLSHCTQEHGSATTNELDDFYEEIADFIYERVDGHFETR